MWLSTPSTEALTRPRLAVAVVSAVAAVSVGYLAYQSRRAQPLPDGPSGGSLQRSNAIRRTPRRSRRNNPTSSSSSEAPGDENVEASNPLAADAETVADVAAQEWWNDPAGFPPSQRAGHNIVNLLFRVSEDNARRTGCVHRGCQCNACGMVPIRGVRYRCANCADFDLCETCEAQGVHIKTHIFYKIRVPAPPFGPRQMQPVWYTGDPDSIRRNLPKGLIAKLTRDTGFERPELEAFWEQWTFMANSEWREDPDDLGVAMDRQTFERCLVPTGGSRHAAPNLIHDRMFSFYDSNHDGLIGFSEFLHGLSYRKRKDKLRKVFEGYDIDGDGFVNRRDFLRMFRAYYVLYKQMHKDILEGLEDQLRATIEAQTVVGTRLPISSLFGREGRLPPGDGTMRFEGKTCHGDGSIDVDDGYHDAIVDNRGDTATREDILTSLFAYETYQRPRRRFVARRDTDTNWRTVRRLSGSETDRTYWVTLLEPPATLDELPGILTGTNNPEMEETDDEVDEQADEDVQEDEHEDGNDQSQRDSAAAAGTLRTDSERRARMLSQARRKAPKLEKRRRDMARNQLHERWKRRQFYLDEEEGGLAPDEWDNDEDILAKLNRAVEDAQAADQQAAAPARSRSSSKVRFAGEVDDYDTRSNPSTSSRSVPERWGGMEIPNAERDAGKEILYQVTQQAFNELLDTIFKSAEDLAVEAAETKEQRERHKAEIEAIELDDEKERGAKRPDEEGHQSPRSEEAVHGKSIEDPDEVPEDGLSEDDYAAVTDEPRHAVELHHSINLSDFTIPSESSVTGDDELGEYRDPTLPQFRPNSWPAANHSSSSRRSYSADVTLDDVSDQDWQHPSDSSTVSEPAMETLRRWKLLNVAEAKAAERGGWGRLGFEEFETIYKNQEDMGNRLDYLGSWIDFCIP
ncbi:zinc finger, ZZ type domain-containing protein [Hirsutella rhossiliensis]|uniref:Zinc finger, ZZ type domain-containing protein n=1 Tax=Hirsutella rhossiliensis TaxID=111463 RepID=A0A9P8MXP0_9HYPO|nr:zinc finger, ZZ type domain-containing protein [Hirsutella rhossiliensis]KAH0962186.1 zinc finger, ZZ type domain-containing protein [Hirsutella rhossiliensis]